MLIMGRIILVTGGSRSGKSAFAQHLAETLPGPRAYVATCPVLDEEMLARVVKHRKARNVTSWDTIEETVDLARVLRESRHPVILIDCLTLWINNLMYRAEQEHLTITEEQVSSLCHDLLSWCRNSASTVIFVTNEVGMGIVPENASARLFRDLSGRAGQVIASGADEVYVTFCGIPVLIKGSSERKLV
jgi:adenosylcobinamide kinase / adenosylcobinamide-phosphate guanylyltransferase